MSDINTAGEVIIGQEMDMMVVMRKYVPEIVYKKDY